MLLLPQETDQGRINEAFTINVNVVISLILSPTTLPFIGIFQQNIINSLLSLKYPWWAPTSGPLHRKSPLQECPSAPSHLWLKVMSVIPCLACLSTAPTLSHFLPAHPVLSALPITLHSIHHGYTAGGPPCLCVSLPLPLGLKLLKDKGLCFACLFTLNTWNSALHLIAS